MVRGQGWSSVGPRVEYEGLFIPGAFLSPGIPSVRRSSGVRSGTTLETVTAATETAMPKPSQRRGASLHDPTPDDLKRLLPYVAALELEVDRLRRHNRLVHQEARAALLQVQEL